MGKGRGRPLAEPPIDFSCPPQATQLTQSANFAHFLIFPKVEKLFFTFSHGKEEIKQKPSAFLLAF